MCSCSLIITSWRLSVSYLAPHTPLSLHISPHTPANTHEASHHDGQMERGQSALQSRASVETWLIGGGTGRDMRPVIFFSLSFKSAFRFLEGGFFVSCLFSLKFNHSERINSKTWPQGVTKLLLKSVFSLDSFTKSQFMACLGILFWEFYWARVTTVPEGGGSLVTPSLFPPSLYLSAGPGTGRDINGSACVSQSLWLLLACFTCLFFKC